VIISTITDLVPSEIFPRDPLNLPLDIRLVNPDFHLPRLVDLLIGSSATKSLLSDGQLIYLAENATCIFKNTFRFRLSDCQRGVTAIIKKYMLRDKFRESINKVLVEYYRKENRVGGEHRMRITFFEYCLAPQCYIVYHFAEQINVLATRKR